MIARLARAVGHRCTLPPAWRTAHLRCWCGQRWTSVFVAVLGYRWYQDGQVRFP